MIKLNVKSPTSVEDKCLTTTLSSTVREVKIQIQVEWPSHPSPQDQRLVYAGKLLEDGSVLQDVLRLEDARDVNDAFTIHLVCRGSIPKVHVQPASGLHHQPPEPISMPTETTLRRRTNILETSTPDPNVSYDQQQAAMMHQMYANYMTQYVQYLQSIGAISNWPQSAEELAAQDRIRAEEARAVGFQPGGGPVFDPVAAAAVAGAVANNWQPQPQGQQPQVQAAQVQVNNQVPVENNNNIEAAAAGAAAAPNVVMNAGAGGIGAMEDDDDLNGGQRDVLDWCYVVTRALVLFSVVYFYSSLARFALAAGLGIIFYLYNNGFFGQQNQPQRPQQQQQQDAAVNEVRQAAGGGDNENNEPPTNDANTGQGAEAAAVVLEEPRPQFLDVLSTFITTFFTSLLPNDPQVV